MQQEFDKINAKLDAIGNKIDSFHERISKVEAHQSWLKTGLLAVFAWIGSHFFKG